MAQSSEQLIGWARKTLPSLQQRIAATFARAEGTRERLHQDHVNSAETPGMRR